ncbi:MAG: DUF4255 domain-containing protein [Bacteroidota bacterium]
MIDKAVGFLHRELNQYLKRQFQDEADFVVLSPFVDQDGSIPIVAEGVLLLNIINIEREGVLHHVNPVYRKQSGNYLRQSPPLNLNVYLMLASAFPAENYVGGLTILSEAIQFFQNQYVFTPAQHPSLPEEFDKLSLEIVNMSLQEMSHLWGALGAKYAPSIIYKMRMLTIDTAQIKEVRKEIRGTDTQLTN